MFLIQSVNEENCLCLNHSENVFHEAALSGQTRVRVKRQDGEQYGLVKLQNSDCVPEYFKKRWPGQTVFFEYEEYDENSEGTMYLSFLRHFERVRIEIACEYTIVLARLILKHTDAEVTCTDERMKWFIEDSRIEYIPDSDGFEEDEKTLIILGSPDKYSELDPEHRVMGPIAAFHNVFFLQGTGVFDLSTYRYAEVLLDEQAGIGSVLNNISRFSQAVESLGLKLISRRKKLGKYPTSFLNNTLNFNLSVEDADDDNTLLWKENAPYVATWFFLKFEPYISPEILNPDFRHELDEYSEAVIGNKRFLGVLIRGTDYILVNNSGERRMASVEEMIPQIDKWMKEDKYERIVLATEDLDILEKMRERYSSKVIAVSQERHRVTELVGGKLLSDLEKENGKDYYGTLADDTVNYLYAMYLISKCEAFLCSGYCNGYDLAVAFNDGHFKKTGLFHDGKWIIKESEE